MRGARWWLTLGVCWAMTNPLAHAQGHPAGVPPPAGGPEQPRRDDATGPRLRFSPSIRIDLSKLFNQAAEEPTHEPGQVLVLWPDEDSARDGLAWIAQREQLQPAEWHALPTLGGVLAMYQLPEAAQAQLLRQRLRSAQPAWVVDLNARATPQQRGGTSAASSSTDSAAVAPAAANPRLYALAMLGLTSRPTAWPERPDALRIGVIDSALDPRLLQAAAAGWWSGRPPLPRSLLAATDTPAPPGHGHQVAMLLAGASLSNGFAGAAPDVPLHWAAVMRRVGAATSTNSLLLARALDWLLGQKVQLINLSAGGAGDDILRSVVGQVLARDVILVAAAGNRPDAQAVYPAAYAGVWAVTAVDARGQVYERASRAAHVSFAAPGVEVWVPDPMAAGGSLDAPIGSYVSGTSFATALASGALARLDPDFWRLTPAARLARLCGAARSSAQPQPQPQAVLGCGLLNLEALAPRLSTQQ